MGEAQEQTKKDEAAFQKEHAADLEALTKDLWVIRRQSRPMGPGTPMSWEQVSFSERSYLLGDVAELLFDPDNQVRIRRMLRLPLVRELFEARDITFSRAAQLLGLKPEELCNIAADEGWKARCEQEAAWWKEGKREPHSEAAPEKKPWDERGWEPK